MQLNEVIARQIVERAMKIIHYSINVMDEKGRIIGSGDPNRLYQQHEGAILALNDNRVVDIDIATAENLKGVKPGINLPIHYQNQPIGVVGISGEPNEVRYYGELVKMTAELIVEQADMMSKIQWNKRHREELLLQLIKGSSLNEDQLNSIAQRLNLDLSQPRIAAVVKVFPKKGHVVTLEHLQRTVHLLEYPERDNLVGILSVSANEVVVLKPITLTAQGWSWQSEAKRTQQLLKRVKQEPQFSIKIALGEYFPSLSGLSQSFETAKLTLKHTVNHSGSMFFYQDYKLPVLLSGIRYHSWQSDLLRKPMEKLHQHDKKGVLLKTLCVYFSQNCDLHQTSALLHIHRNTLRYRLEQIETITSLSFNKLDEKTLLYLATNFY